MPEMVPTYEHLCHLANADGVAARFLTGFQPPAYISACSQAVSTNDKIQLVRNYDYHPDLIEGTLLMSAWNGKKVIANSDCLVGALDGMNEDGLVISLTFGGRKEVGKGFGIPFILRYVLEFCSNVEEAVEALIRIPSHMSYNVTVIDKSGAFKTVRLSPDRAPLVTDAACATNHQGAVDWPENAQFNKTIERYNYLENSLSDPNLDSENLANSFLQKPLYNTQFTEGFGTLYTAVYQPSEGIMQLRWPNDRMTLSFNDFREENKLIMFDGSSNIAPPAPASIWEKEPAITHSWSRENQNGNENVHTYWQETVTDTLVNAMEHSVSGKNSKKLKKLRKNMINRGQISWEILADYWSNIGRGYWDKWKN
jgi:predicted choloylglycine hydrolase